MEGGQAFWAARVPLRIRLEIVEVYDNAAQSFWCGLLRGLYAPRTVLWQALVPSQHRRRQLQTQC